MGYRKLKVQSSRSDATGFVAAKHSFAYLAFLCIFCLFYSIDAQLCVSNTLQHTNTKPPIVSLLPKDDEIKGWKVYPDTLTYCKGQELTKIYNGGYKLYLSYGVIEAVTQLYQTKKEDIITVTIHKMASKQAAIKFFQYWLKTNGKSSHFETFKISDKVFMVSNDDTVESFLIVREYFITNSSNQNDSNTKNALMNFLKLLSRKISQKT